MSYATETLKKTLLYDRQAGTLHLSEHIPQLRPIRDALFTTFGATGTLLTEVEEVGSVPTPSAGLELLHLHGKTHLSGDEYDILLEFGLNGTEVATIFICILLPNDWALDAVFAKLSQSHELPADGRLQQGILVISSGLSHLSGDLLRMVEEFRTSLFGEPPVIRQPDYPLQDGFQIIATLPDGAADTLGHDLELSAQVAGMESVLSELESSPLARAEIRANARAGWLTYERWWDRPDSDSTAAMDAQALGLGIRYKLDGATKPETYWLQAIGTAADPIIIEAWPASKVEAPKSDEDFYPVRYISRMARKTLLGETNAALTALLGERSHVLTTMLEGVLPKAITLQSLVYASDQFIQLAFAAGDHSENAGHVVKLGPAIELQEVEFSVNVPLGEAQLDTAIELEAWAEFFGERFHVRLEPWTFLQGSLDAADGVDLGHLIAKATSLELPFGLDNVNLAGAWLTCVLDEQSKALASTDLRLRLEGTVDLVPGAIQLDALELEFIREDGRDDVDIRAEFRMGPVNLFAEARHYQGGWVFNGATKADGKGIPLTELVAHLLHHFGAAIPVDVPDVYLETLALEYETETRSLNIQATTHWDVPTAVPVLGGSHSSAMLQLTMMHDAGEGGHQSVISIDWTLEKSGHQLAANALLAGDDQSFGFDFTVPDAKQPIKLTDFTDAIGLDGIPSEVATGIDAILQLSALSLDYDRAAARFTVAWSRPLPDIGGLLLTEYEQENEAGAGDRRLEVSWLAIEDETLGITPLLGLIHGPDVFDTLEGWARPIGLDGVMKDVEEMLTFRQLGFTLDEQDDDDTITVTAQSTYSQDSADSAAGSSAFIIVSKGENEGVIAGVSLLEESTDGHSPDEQAQPRLPAWMPGSVQQMIKAALEVVRDISLTHIIVSTVTRKHFRPPAHSADAAQPSYARQGSPLSLPFGMGPFSVGQGIAVGARVQFGDHALIRRVIDVDELDGQLTLGEKIALEVSIPKTLKLSAGGGNKLALTSPLLRLQESGDEIEFDIQGGLNLQLFGQMLDVNGWLSLAEESLTAHLQFTELDLPVPITPSGFLPGVQLVVDEKHPLSLEVGLQFEPPGLDLGLSGSFAVYKNATQKVYGDAAFVLEIVEEIPQPLYVEFGMDEISIPVLLEAKTGAFFYLNEGKKLAEKISRDAAAADDAIEHALNHVSAVLSKAELLDVRLRWADSIVNLPDGSVAMPGVQVRGAVKIFDWKAFAVIDLSLAQDIPGLSGHFEAEEIKIGRVLRIWGDGTGISKTPKTANDFNKLMKEHVDKLEQGEKPSTAPSAEPDTKDWFLKPGGPVLHLSTRSSPFLHADLHAELFGFLHAGIHADVTDAGFDFDFKIGAGEEVTAELECHWWHDQGQLEAHGDIGVHLNGDIGPIIPHVSATAFHLDTNLDARATLIVNSKEFKLTLNGDFEFQGARLTIPELVLTEEFSSLEAMAEAVWKHVEENAEDIFEEYLAPIGRVVAEGAEKVAAIAKEGAKEVAHVATEAAHEAKQITEAMAASAEQEVDQIGQAATKLTEQAEDVALHAAEKAAEAAAPLIAKAEELTQTAVRYAAEAAEAVKHTLAVAAALVDEAVHYAIDVAEKAAHWVEARLDDARRWASARLEEARKAVQQIEADAEEAVHAIEAKISAIEHEIEHLLSRAAHEAEYVVSSGWHEVKHGLASIF